MCRYDNFGISDFSSKSDFWKSAAWLVLRRSSLSLMVYIFYWKVHIWVVRTYIFWPKVHIWVVRTLYVLKKSLNLGRKSSQVLKRPLIWVVSQVNFWKGSWYMKPQSVYFWWEVHIVYFGCLNLYFGCFLQLHRRSYSVQHICLKFWGGVHSWTYQ